MATKNITLRKEIDGILYELMIATNTAQVLDASTNKSLATILTEILASIGEKAAQTDLEALQTKFNNLVKDAPEAYDTLLEISQYIATHQDEYSALMDLTANKVDKVEGKGLSSNDFTNELLEKLSALYTKDELDAKFAAAGTGSSVSSENVTYTNESYPEITTVTEALNKALSKETSVYTPIDETSGYLDIK